MGKKKNKKAKETAKRVQDEVLESAHKVWLAGLGAMSTIGEGGDRLFRDLVAKGREMEKKGKREAREVRDDVETRVENAKGRFEEGMKDARVRVEKGVDAVWSTVDDRVGEVMGKLGVPTRDEIQRLTKKVEELNAKIDALRGGGQGAGASNGRTVYHVQADGSDWKVELEGASSATSVHDTKSVAVAAARELAKSRLPSTLVVHRKDGSVQDSFDYDDELTH